MFLRKTTDLDAEIRKMLDCGDDDIWFVKWHDEVSDMEGWLTVWEREGRLMLGKVAGRDMISVGEKARAVVGKLCRLYGCTTFGSIPDDRASHITCRKLRMDRLDNGEYVGV